MGESRSERGGLKRKRFSFSSLNQNAGEEDKNVMPSPSMAGLEMDP